MRKNQFTKTGNPGVRGRRYASDLHVGSITDHNGVVIKPLNPIEASWRSGYLQSRTDCATAYKYNQKKAQKVSASKKAKAK